MKVALWNLNGIASKDEELNGMMRSTNASCGIITETWMPFHTVNYCTFEGFRGSNLACFVRIIYSGDRFALCEGG